MEGDAYFVGASKKDLDNHWAQIVCKFGNFRSGKDKVDVTVSNIGVDRVVIILNGAEVYNSVLPGPVTKCKHKVSSERGNKGKLVIKLEKLRPGNWVDKWSPSRNDASPSFGSLAGTDSLSSDSHISLPKFFDNSNSSKNGAESSHL